LVKAGGIYAAAVSALAATGAAAECRLALLLAIDVSSSVDPSEDALQRGGLASALVAPEVMAAFFATDAPVALAAFEWSGRYNQALLLDWTMINAPEDLTDAALAISSTQRSQDDYPTAMGYALGYGATLLEQAPVCDAQVIDIAGDGISNDGFAPALAYAYFPFQGVTVNGLVVLDGRDDAALLAFYQREVIRGRLAFVEMARGFADYENAMQRKLLRELSVRVIGARPVQAPGTGPAG